MNRLSNHNCPVCASADLEVFFEMLAVPVYCNLLWRSRQTAQNCPKGDIKLGFCPSCGFISNLAFDPIYEQEIRQLCKNLGLTPELMCV
ncbi:hypothetical protein [Moorena bouillonii]|uniref:Uncharacterized protein n=1 Tax=Moorena bouillonii PNG TaxID=568701 RepID=A0A1U7MVY2_9CYAN|nr:hypothetical protein [Moorena bouillonii]OLT57853.1 hypothetical protein BJP37_01110 [Moorena bouillonii PNG]